MIRTTRSVRTDLLAVAMIVGLCPVAVLGSPADDLVGVCLQGTNAEEVAAAAEQVLEHHRDHPQAWRVAEILAHYRAARGEYRAATRLFALGAARAPASEEPRLLLLRARALLGAGQSSEAREVCEALLRRTPAGDPTAAAALLAAGDAAHDSGDLAAAHGFYAGYLERFEGDDYEPVALAQMARVLAALERPREEHEILLRLVERHPDSLEAAPARDRLRAGQTAVADTTALSIMATMPLTGDYSLQIGAFGSEANARELVRRLDTLGLQGVRVEREERATQIFYRVRVGAFETEEAARVAGEALRSTHGLAFQVVER